MIKESPFVDFLVRTSLFKGQNLIEEMSFVRYFHNHPWNVLLHLIGFHFFLFGVLLLLKQFSYSYCDLLLVVSYSFGYLALDVCTGCIGSFFTFMLYYAASSVSASSSIIMTSTPVALLFIALGGAIQLVGHIIFDKSQPAFRFFEAFFTTPFFLYLNVLFIMGFQKKMNEEIVNKTSMWKGSERVTYGERTFFDINGKSLMK